MPEVRGVKVGPDRRRRRTVHHRFPSGWTLQSTAAGGVRHGVGDGGGVARRVDGLGRPHLARPVRPRRGGRHRRRQRHRQDARRLLPGALPRRRWPGPSARCSWACRRCASRACSSPSRPWRSRSCSTRTSSTPTASAASCPTTCVGRCCGNASTWSTTTTCTWCASPSSALSILAAMGVRKARSGRVVIATRDNQRAADAAAVNTTAVKLSAFLLAGFIAGIAGGLHVQIQHALAQNTYSPVDSITVFSTAVIGGLGSMPRCDLGRVAVPLAGDDHGPRRTAPPAHRHRSARRALRAARRLRSAVHHRSGTATCGGSRTVAASSCRPRGGQTRAGKQRRTAAGRVDRRGGSRRGTRNHRRRRTRRGGAHPC